MFDRLIESESKHADLQGRRRCFIISTFIVGTLFISAVVISLYAADIDIGDAEFDMTRLVAPEIVDVPQPPEPPDRMPASQERSENSDVPQRRDNIARIDEHQTVPTTISVVPSTIRSRPTGRFQIGPADIDPAGAGTRISDANPGTGSGVGGPGRSDGGNLAEMSQAEPPPARRPLEKRPLQSKGVVNGIAISLPKPPYPAPARAIGAAGNVDVQVTIDETGRVVSARAVAGHPLLRQAAEKAAWSAKFKPTLLSDQPVKVTGVIIYKFIRD